MTNADQFAENTTRDIRPIHRLPVEGDEDRVVIVNGELAKEHDAGDQHVQMEAEDLNGERVYITVAFENGLSVSAHWPEQAGGVELKPDDSVESGVAFSDPAVQLVGDVQIVKESEA
jgi:hypothetical protein